MPTFPVPLPTCNFRCSVIGGTKAGCTDSTRLSSQHAPKTIPAATTAHERTLIKEATIR